MNIILIYGGKSCEHDISVITACLAKGYFKGNIYGVYFDRENKCYLLPNGWTPKQHLNYASEKRAFFLFGEKKIAVYKGKRIKQYIDADVAVNCCHGMHGEDGTVAAICQMSGVPLVGSDMLSSALAMDKIFSKTALSALGFPVVNGVGVNVSQKDTFEPLGLNYPLIVKPSRLGSSIGVKVCKDASELKTALADAFKYDSDVLCEEALADFYELNCSAMKVKGEVITSKVDCPYTVHDILTFEDKYISNEACSKNEVSADSSVIEQVKEMTGRIYGKLKFKGVIRVDYLLDKTDGKLYVNEINTIPGSLAYGLWGEKFTRTEFGEALVEEAVADNRATLQHVYSFESGVLNGCGIKKK